MRLPLACTVRSCGLPLEQQAQQYVCPRGHSFDIARSGYVNLLQPQDRRSTAAGDRRTSIEARARLLAAGVGRKILDEAIDRAAALDLRPEAVVVDLGAGSGEALAALAERRTITGIGIDLAPAAAEHTARRFPSLTWLVANADHRLPLVDGSVDLVLSIHGRRNPEESLRVLMPQAHLLVTTPAEDDLIELRASVLGKAVRRDRSGPILREHSRGFALLTRHTAREQHVLTREQLRDLLQGTYRGARASEANRADALDSLKVTLASEILLFRRSGDRMAHRRR